MALSLDELNQLSKTGILSPIPPQTLLPALSSPPFIPLLNGRDLGALPGSPIPANRIFRTGMLDNLAADPTLLPPGVKRIYDFRTDAERGFFGADPELPGVVANVWFEPTGDDTKPDLESFVEGEGEKGLRGEYLKVLRIYMPTVRKVLEDVRDFPGEGFLFHCTAGRDRTGVLAGLLLALAGASPELIKDDYLLSRIGIEPGREKLLAYAKRGTGLLADAKLDRPGFLNLATLSRKCWDAFVEGLDEEYGGWDGYVTSLGFDEKDLGVIKANLREGK